MGASLAYLKEPNKDIEQEEGSNSLLSFATGSMQGWRLNMEDAHIASLKFLGSDQKALFGVFDGHGGREVAVWCNKHYENILNRDFNKDHSEEERKEWLRKSFLNVDEDLKKPTNLK
jgi:serine/threonine protein phosphatase PrpC